MIVKSSWNGPRAVSLGQGKHIGGHSGGAHKRLSPFNRGGKISMPYLENYVMHQRMSRPGRGTTVPPVVSKHPMSFPKIQILS